MPKQIETESLYCPVDNGDISLFPFNIAQKPLNKPPRQLFFASVVASRALFQLFLLNRLFQILTCITANCQIRPTVWYIFHKQSIECATLSNAW